MRQRLFGGADALTLGLLVAGAALLAIALVAAFELLVPAAPPSQQQAETATTQPALPGSSVATVLYVDVANGAGSATRAGDHIDVLGYFPRQVAGVEGVTRLLLQDVSVLNVNRTGSTIALTLAIPQESALLLQEAQALGARPFVALRSTQSAAIADSMPASFSDADLADRIGAASSSTTTARAR